MLGSELAASLPDEPIARSAAMLAHVEAGHALELLWLPIVSTLNDGAVPRWVASFWVTTDALQLGQAGDSFRATFNDRDQIQLCELIGCSRTTGKLSDLTWLQAPIKLTPHLHGNTVEEQRVMHTKRVMLLHSAEIDEELASLGGESLTVAPSVIRRPVGKDWCASNLNVVERGSRKATNYGWHTLTRTDYRSILAPGVYVYQPFANKHWWTHTDYSQTATFVRPNVSLTDTRTGETAATTLADINADRTLAKLWSHEGPIREAVPASERIASINWTAYGAAGLVAVAAIAAAIKLARG